MVYLTHRSRSIRGHSELIRNTKTTVSVVHHYLIFSLLEHDEEGEDTYTVNTFFWHTTKTTPEKIPKTQRKKEKEKNSRMHER